MILGIIPKNTKFFFDMPKAPENQQKGTYGTGPNEEMSKAYLPYFL